MLRWNDKIIRIVLNLYDKSDLFLLKSYNHHFSLMKFRIFIQFYLESTMYDEKDTNIPLLRYLPKIVDKTPSCEIYLMNKKNCSICTNVIKATST